MYKVNVFSAKLSFEWIQQLEKIKPPSCHFYYHYYTNTTELNTILEKHLHDGDAALFSGQIPYFFAQANFRHINLPMMYFDISERDFYRVLTEVFYEKKINIHKIAIDFCYEENGYLGIDEWSKGKKPILFSQTMNDYAHHHIIEHAANWHIALHQNNKVELSLTRIAEMREILAANNIPFIALNPSLHAMQLTVDELLNKLQLKTLQQNKAVVIQVLVPIDKANIAALEYRQIALYKAVLDFKQLYANDFIIQKEASHITIITTYKHFIETTANYTHCQFVNFLNEHLSFPVKVGWGVGQSLLDSQQLAKEAAIHCSSKETQGYIFKDSQQIGPLLPGITLQYNSEKQQRLLELSSTYDISLAQLQKIEAMLEKLETPIVNGELISTHLNITTRSANRILKQLQEKGLAKELASTTLPTRGRPKKYYEVLL